MNNNTVVQKFWRLCGIPRDGGITYLRRSSPQSRRLIVGDAKSASRAHNVNVSELRSMPLALPPLAERRELIVRAHRRFCGPRCADCGFRRPNGR